MPYVLVDPSSVLNWSNDWATEWLADGDTIASRQWSIEPLNGTSPETPTLTNDTNDVVFVSGLQTGKIYRLTEHVVTVAGLEDDRSIMLRCDDT
jgi:streptogramin lyase